MLRTARVALLSIGLLASATALGADRRGKPAEYQASELTEAERAAARERARNRMNAWGADEPAPEFKFPWMMVVFAVAAFGLAAPFAYGAYQRQAKELREAEAFAPPAGRKRKAAEGDDEEG